jgi:hypothetical protein
MASSPITAANNYQPWGVMSIMHGHMIGRIKSRGNDELGRWTFVKLLGRSDKVITLISAYQVCNNDRTGTTAYHQQRPLIQRGAEQPAIQDDSSSKTFGNSSTNAKRNPNLLSSLETLTKTWISTHLGQPNFAKNRNWSTFSPPDIPPSKYSAHMFEEPSASIAT